MRSLSERERFLRAFHDARPGITSRAFRRGGSYERLAARVRDLVPTGRVLDLACGDGTLLQLLGDAIGVDVSLAELRRARGAVTCARAQALPFAEHSFAAATCHLAFMLFDDIERVVAELARVLRPGAPFIALVGGGPIADGPDGGDGGDARDGGDAFHHFAALLPRGTGFGDRRANSEAGWRELFTGWRDITLERWPLDLGGAFDEVWSFLSSSYQHRDDDRIRAELRAAFTGDHVPCMVATYCATAIR